MKKTKILICLFVAAVMSGFNALSAQDTTAVQQVVVPEGFAPYINCSMFHSE